MRVHGDAVAVRAPSAALLAFGIGGLVVLAIALVLAFAAIDAAERLVRTVGGTTLPEVERRLAVADAALDEAGLAVAGLDLTLDGTAASARSARELSARLGGALRELAVALDVTVLGSRPFAGLRSEFEAVADDAAVLADDLGTTAAALDANRTALLRLRGEIASLRDVVTALREDLGGAPEGPEHAVRPDDRPAPSNLPAPETFAVARVVAAALVGWLSIPAIAACVVALRRVRWRAADAPVPDGA